MVLNSSTQKHAESSWKYVKKSFLNPKRDSCSGRVCLIDLLHACSALKVLSSLHPQCFSRHGFSFFCRAAAQLVCNGTQNSNEAASRNSNEAASRKEEKPDTEWSSRWQDYEAERTESWRDCAIDYVMSRFVCLQRTERSGPHFFGFLNNVGGCPNPYS